MKQGDSFDLALSAWLDQEAESQSPGYLREVLDTTRQVRQRPPWSSVQRWLPMPPSVRMSAIPRVAWLLVTLALLLAITAAIASLGSPRVPPPFGPASNGTLLFGRANGDIYAVDIATGASTPVVTGATSDETPDFSHDGTRFAFARESEVNGLWLLMVANADGSGPRPITGPIYPTWNAWSPDDSEILVVDTSTSPPALRVHDVNTGVSRTLDIEGLLPERVSFEPDGDEVVFLGSSPGSYGLYAIATDGESAMRALMPAVPTARTITHPTLSPDGLTLAYTRWDVDHSVIHLVDMGTGVDRPIQLDAASDGESVRAWSPDRSKMLFQRHAAGTIQLAVGPAFGGPMTLLGPSLDEGTGGVDATFSPDGGLVLATYEADGSTWLLDALTGLGAELDTGEARGFSWQRRVP